MADGKVRRRRNTGDDELREPLLDDEGQPSPSRPSTSGYEGHERSRSALVPHTINRIDWEALLQAFVDSCRAGWSGVLATIASCLGTFFPQQLQPITLSHIQEQRLEALQERIMQQYDPESSEHRQELLRLWGFAFPGVASPSGNLRDQKWTEMGWQRDDPASDFRGAGFISLENHLYMAQHQPELFQRLLHKAQGQRSQWEYPFAVAGINLTFMLEQLLDLRKQHAGAVGHTPSTTAGRAFLTLVTESEHAFEQVYCLAFDLLDRVWLDMRASYMDFSQVLARVRSQLESALTSGGVRCMADLRAMLK